MELTYISRGYSNWKDATTNFMKHEQSKCHIDAVLKIVTIPKSMGDVQEMLSAQCAKDKLERRQHLMKILENIKFLARQGLPLRGDGDECDSNFIQLLKLRAIDDSRILQWLNKKTDKYTSAVVQNEMIQVMALKVLRDVAASLHSSKFFTIMADETTDVANQEQVVICLRWVDDDFEIHEEFIGLYKVDSIAASTLVQVIKDVLLRMNLSLDKARGQCYDGAAAMAGCRSGIAKRISDEEPRAVFMHCYGHALDLAISDTVKNCDCINNALSDTREITTFIKGSPQRQTQFQHIKDSVAPLSPGIRTLCPTRWTIRAASLQSVLDNYEVLLQTWDALLEITKESDVRARIDGMATKMNTFTFFFGVTLSQLLFVHTDNLSKTLQGTSISAAEGQTVASMTVKTLMKIRDSDSFQLFWRTVTEKATQLGIDEPVLPRRRRVPRRFEAGTSEAEFPSTPEIHYRRIYYESLDLVVARIQERFDQPGFRTYSKLECLILKAAQRATYEVELAFVSDMYSGDFNFTQDST